MNEHESLIRIEWGEQLQTFTVGELAAWGFDPETSAFLQTIGLPQSATNGGMINVNFWQPSQFKTLVYDSYKLVVVGETDSYAWIAVHLKDGLVYAVSDDGSPGMGFVNSSLKALLACLTMYHREFIDHPEDYEDDLEWDETDGHTGTPISRARATRIRERLLQLDPLALDSSLNVDTADVTVWEFVAEEVEYGIL